MKASQAWPCRAQSSLWSLLVASRMVFTNWALNVVFEVDVGHGYGLGVRLPERGEDIRLTIDFPAFSSNMEALVGVSWSTRF